MCMKQWMLRGLQTSGNNIITNLSIIILTNMFRASATAKATVAAFAASEGHAHPRVVELPKTEEGLGFNVMGGKEQNSPIYISRIIPGRIEKSLLHLT